MPKDTENQQSQSNNQSLLDFDFNDDVSFFGIKGGGENETDTTLKEVKKTSSTGQAVTDLDKEPKNQGKKGEDEEEEDEPTFFGEENEEEKEDEEDEKEDGKKKSKKKEGVEDEEKSEEDDEKEDVEEVKDPKKKKDRENEEDEDDEEDKKFFTQLAAELKEKGIFQNVEIKEGEEIDTNKFFELHDAEIESRVEETLQSFFTELKNDPDAEAFIRYKKAGGRTSDFFATYANDLPLEEFDEENEDQRKAVINHYLTVVEKMDAEEAKDRAEWLKDSGKEKSASKKYFDTIKKIEKEAKDKVLEVQNQIAKQREEDQKAFSKDLTKVLSETESVGNFRITKEDQKILSDFILKPTVKVGKGKYVPEINQKLSTILKAETPEAKQQLLLLAKLLKSNFDTTDVLKKAETNVSRKVKSKLQQAKLNPKATNSGSYSGRRELADYFGEQ